MFAEKVGDQMEDPGLAGYLYSSSSESASSDSRLSTAQQADIGQKHWAESVFIVLYWIHHD